MRRAWTTCAVLSIAAHALAVTLMPPLERPVRTAQADTKPGARPAAWHMRLVQQPTAHTAVPASPPLAAPQPVQTEAPAPAEEIPTEVAAPEVVLTDPSEPPPTPEALPAIPSEVAAPTVANDLPSGNGQADLDGNSEYIPRPQLSIPPIAQAPLILGTPEGPFEPQRITGILSLYIDENGQVHHVSAHGERMPAAFEEVARQAFMAMTFRPGQLNGQPVKSRIRIEVVFDNTPLPSEKAQP